MKEEQQIASRFVSCSICKLTSIRTSKAWPKSDSDCCSGFCFSGFFCFLPFLSGVLLLFSGLVPSASSAVSPAIFLIDRWHVGTPLSLSKCSEFGDILNLSDPFADSISSFETLAVVSIWLFAMILPEGKGELPRIGNSC